MIVARKDQVWEHLMANHSITLIETAIHNPNEPRHFMILKPVSGLLRIRSEEMVLVESRRALCLVELGRALYDPTYYIPRDDVLVGLNPIADYKTHCPLKGDASYFDLDDFAPEGATGPIAWSYQLPFDFASEIAVLIAFDQKFFTVELTGNLAA